MSDQDKRTKRTKKVRKPMDPNATADIDQKTMQVFARKGYEVLTMLGRGAFGEVYKAVRKSNNELCAVKVIDLSRCSAKFRQKFLPRELAALMEVQHENIIRVYDIFRSNKKIFVFMEYAHSDLAKVMKELKQPLTEERARYYFEQIAQAIRYLHEEMLTAHRDIKIENILLSDDDRVKLADFGFACEAIDEYGNVIYSETFCGTLPYYCPQILQKRPYNPFKADIWATGVVLYATTHNRFPFHHKNPKKMLLEQMDRNFLKSRFRNSITWELKDLLTQMFEVNEDKRLSISQVIKHDWMNME